MTAPRLPGPPVPAGEHVTAIRDGIRRHLLVGGIAAAVLVFGLGGMAATIDFAGAVVATGKLVVSSAVKKIQHQAGGTISAIAVKDGDRVAVGDLLVQLDPTLAAANLAIVTKGLDEALAQKARLEAEYAGRPAIDFPPDLLSRANEPAAAAAISVERGAFESRRTARAGQTAQLTKKIAELQEQLVGVKAQEDATQRQIDLTRSDLEGLRMLRAKDLVSTDRLSTEERRLAQLDGEHGQLVASEAQLEAEQGQAQLQITQIGDDMKSEVSASLADAGSKINELTERKIAAEDQLAKLAIKAPINGIVYQLAVHTVGGVIGPGETMMLVVPEKDLLVVEAQVSPSDVDRVHPQQEAMLRFSSLGGRTTPQYSGTVETLSPDVVVDQRTGQGSYTVRVKIPPAAIADLGTKMVPGIPVEVFISTGPRTVLSYLIKPLGDQIMQGFREK